MALTCLADAFDKPEDSPEHRVLRDTVWLGGSYVECRYYLGILTGRNEFRTSEDEFLEHLTEFVTAKTSDGAALFCCSINHCDYVVDFLRRMFDRKKGVIRRVPERKELRALEVLLRYPEWSDEQIVTEVGATIRSIKRWPRYRDARRAQRFFEQRVEGWYYPLRLTRAHHWAARSE